MLAKTLNNEGYYQAKHTPGLWTQETWQISFTLVVNDLGVKYVNKEDVHHLENILEAVYPCKSDWTGNRYVWVHLKWDYKKRTLRTSMPGYVKKSITAIRIQAKKWKKTTFTITIHGTKLWPESTNDRFRFITSFYRSGQNETATINWEISVLWKSSQWHHATCIKSSCNKGK